MGCLKLPNSEECYGFRTALLARYVTAIYDTVLQERGISSARMHVLVMLHENPDSTAGELRLALHSDFSTILHLLRGLMQQKHVELGPARRCGRKSLKTYKLTRSGKACLSACTYDWQRAQERMREVVGRGLLESLFSRVPAIQGINPRPERRRHRPIYFYDYAEEANDWEEG
jgi:DNA-binding MarR family transcriptional regulator